MTGARSRASSVLLRAFAPWAAPLALLAGWELAAPSGLLPHRLSAQQLVASLWAQHRFTAVLVTHDVSEAVRLCDRVLVLDGGRIGRSVDVSLPHPRARHWPELAQLERLLLHTIGGDALAPEPWSEQDAAPREWPARVAGLRSAAR
jgi:hypothetical protein